MPISYRIESDLGLLTVTATGEISDNDLQAYKTALMDDPNLHCVSREICDFREAMFSDSSLSMVDAARLHQGVFAAVGSTKCAVIVANDLLYGLVRMYTQCVGRLGHEVLPFRGVREAREWLGLPVDDGDDQPG